MATVVSDFLSKRRGRRSGFTLVETLFAIGASGFIILMALAGMRVAVTTYSLLSNQTRLREQGQIALERVQRSLRGEFLSFFEVNNRIEDLGLEGGLLYFYDSNHDGQSDGIRGWHLRRPANAQAGDDTWELVEYRDNAPPVLVCRDVVAPWTTADGVHTYRPFELAGSDLALNVGNDGGPATGDEGEGDGLVNEIEIGNFYNGNGVIDHPVELAKITSIRVGLKLRAEGLALSRYPTVEFTAEGAIRPRNRATP